MPLFQRTPRSVAPATTRGSGSRRSSRASASEAGLPPAAAPEPPAAPAADPAGNEVEDWELLMTVGRRETFALGDTVIADGDASEFIYRLVSGEVSVEKGEGNSLLALRRGDMMGELSFLDASLPACASCRPSIKRWPRTC
jgi:hypothetical protein